MGRHVSRDVCKECQSMHIMRLLNLVMEKQEYWLFQWSKKAFRKSKNYKILNKFEKTIKILFNVPCNNPPRIQKHLHLYYRKKNWCQSKILVEYQNNICTSIFSNFLFFATTTRLGFTNKKEIWIIWVVNLFAFLWGFH